jgi:hypothetical protein
MLNFRSPSIYGTRMDSGEDPAYITRLLQEWQDGSQDAFDRLNLQRIASARVAATDAFDRADMRLYAAAARRRLAAITSGDRADLLRLESDAYIAAEDIRNPAAMTCLLAPGFPTTGN